jgi:hypothetical protein
MPSVNTLHERNLHSRSRPREHCSFPLYCVYSVNIDVHMCSILYKLDGLQLVVCACYSWEIALIVYLDV